MITQYSYGQNKCPSGRENVIRRFKMWQQEEVRADLDKNRTEMVCICHNLDYNTNIASVIRSNNAFLGKCVYVVGRRRLDRRSAAGTTHYEHTYHADTFQEVYDKLHEEGYTIYAVDNTEGTEPKNYLDVVYPPKSAFVFGNEGDGLPEEAVKMADEMIYVRQYGSVRSMNVSCCASVLMAEYSRRYRLG